MWWHTDLRGVLTPGSDWDVDRALNQEAHNWETVCSTLLDMGKRWEDIEPRLQWVHGAESRWDPSRMYPIHS